MRPDTRLLALFLSLACCASVDAEETVHIAFIGDSIFEGNYVSAEQRFDQLALTRLKSAYPKQKIEVHNCGKGGATIPKYTAAGASYDKKVRELREIDLCFIEFGPNDEDVSTPEEFRRNLEGLCDRVLSDYPGAKIVLCTSVSCKQRSWWKERGTNAEEPISLKHYAQTRALAKDRNYPLVDIYKDMVEAFKKGDWDLRIRNQKLSQQYYKTLVTDDAKDAERKADGEAWFSDVHPNPRGMERIAAVIESTVKEAYPSALPNEGKAMNK
jgi:lysophospholipase L1-like esterase